MKYSKEVYKFEPLMKEIIIENDWRKTVLALFNSDLLKPEVIKWAEQNSIQIVWGDPNSADIVAYPYFALIVDRKILGDGFYSLYLEYLQDVNTPIDPQKLKINHGIQPQDLSGLLVKEEHSCIIVDNIRDLEIPKLDFVSQINIQSENAINWVIQELDLSFNLISCEKQ